MPSSYKALTVVLFLGALIFRFAKPVALRFSDEQDFARRRKVWFVLTITAFISPSFWILALVTALLLIWAGRKDTNPLALYCLLLHVAPPIGVNIPVVGINRLFELDMYRLLSFFVLLPLAWKLRRGGGLPVASQTRAVDVILVLAGIIQTVVYISPDTAIAATLHDSFTNWIRRASLFFVDAYLVYYAFSRAPSDRRAIAEILAYFCLSCAIMAVIAIFENVRHWLLFESVGLGWGGEVMNQFLERNGMVRAVASAGHPLALGYLMAIAMGFWLYLQSRLDSSVSRRMVMAVFAGGLLAAYSRGPWAGAVVIFFAYVGFGPRALPNLLKAAVTGLLLGLVLIASPLGSRITQVLPFMGGKVDEYNIEYRHRLARRSWDIVRENPWFGDSDAYSKLHDMRQGVGVIDFVNAYAEVAVFYGLVGLVLFVSFMLVGIAGIRRVTRPLQRIDPDLAALGAALGACMIGTLLMIYTSSFVLAYQKMYSVLGGLAAAYIRVAVIRLSEAGMSASAEQSRAPIIATPLRSVLSQQKRR